MTASASENKEPSYILIVEDDDGIRGVLQEALELEGYSVESVVDGQEALDRLERGPVPSLILLDLMLPRVTGWEVIEELRQLPSNPLSKIPIVITSAAGELAARTAQFVEGYLKKPIHLDQMLAIVEGHCGPPNHA